MNLFGTKKRGLITLVAIAVLLLVYMRSEITPYVDKMADAIFVHKNTIYYRIKQVKKLTGCSLLNPEESFLLYIACK